MRVLTNYAVVFGWGVVGAVTMGVSLVLLLKLFTWLTPIDEWTELKNGNVGIAVVLAALILAFGLVVSAAIWSPLAGR